MLVYNYTRSALPMNSSMVAELSEYIPAMTQLGSFAADALMAGIMLDTKNFILRAGAKTFSAAAYLKSQGAETVRVKNLFSNDIESYHIRNRFAVGALSIVVNRF